MESFQGVICDGGDVFATGEGLEDIIVHKCVGCSGDVFQGEGCSPFAVTVVSVFGFLAK